jgi:hypothetical protein
VSLPRRAKANQGDNREASSSPEKGHPDFYELLKERAPEDETL